MHYQISRNGQIYGPYTLEDLQRYIASGNVLLTDLAKSEEMSDWVPVSQLIAAQPGTPTSPAESGFTSTGATAAGFAESPYTGSTFTSPAYTSQDPAYNPLAVPATLAASPYPDAPNLHWGLVLLFDLLTCSIFMWVWNLIVAAWLKRVQPNATSLYYYIGAIVLFFLQFAASVPFAVHNFGPGIHTNHNPLSALFGCLTWVARLVARFSQRASLEEHFNGPEPVGLQLNPVMTFFFGGIYFQYHLNRINQIKQAARYGAGRAF